MIAIAFTRLRVGGHDTGAAYGQLFAQVDGLQGAVEVAMACATFGLSSLRRLGSAPMAAASDGSPRHIVYYNAVLTFERNFDFPS